MKKIIFLLVSASIIIFISLFFKYYKYNKSDGWTYLKYNNILYVLNVESPEDDEKRIKNLELIGNVSKKIPKYFEPIENNTSNGIPKGIEIFKDKYEYPDYSGIYILVNDKYYHLSNTETAEGWGNGIKANFKNLRR